MSATVVWWQRGEQEVMAGLSLASVVGGGGGSGMWGVWEQSKLTGPGRQLGAPAVLMFLGAPSDQRPSEEMAESF